MIREYYRPNKLEEAIELLHREGILTRPLAGGTSLIRRDEAYDVVDLQALPLNGIQIQGQNLRVGAMVTLHQFSQIPEIPANLKKAVDHQDTYNLRQMATLGGCLAAADGFSPLAVALLAADAQLTLKPLEAQVSYGEFLARRDEYLPKQLITEIALPLNLSFAFESVSRTPADFPLVCAALARWNSGRYRLALGGWGKAPMLILDGAGGEGVEAAARSAYSQAQDEWASAEYRADVAARLAERCLMNLAKQGS